MKYEHEGQVEHNIKFDEKQVEKLEGKIERVKTHFKENKKTYLVGVVGLQLGITCWYSERKSCRTYRVLDGPTRVTMRLVRVSHQLRELDEASEEHIIVIQRDGRVTSRIFNGCVMKAGKKFDVPRRCTHMMKKYHDIIDVRSHNR